MAEDHEERASEVVRETGCQYEQGTRAMMWSAESDLYFMLR